MSKDRVRQQIEGYNDRMVVLAAAVQNAQSVEQLAFNPDMTKLSKHDLLRALWNVRHRGTYVEIVPPEEPVKVEKTEEKTEEVSDAVADTAKPKKELNRSYMNAGK